MIPECLTVIKNRKATTTIPVILPVPLDFSEPVIVDKFDRIEIHTKQSKEISNAI